MTTEGDELDEGAEAHQARLDAVLVLARKLTEDEGERVELHAFLDALGPGDGADTGR